MAPALPVISSPNQDPVETRSLVGLSFKIGLTENYLRTDTESQIRTVVVQNRRITQPDWFQDVRHVELRSPMPLE